MSICDPYEVRSYVNLSDHDFELLVADLFHAEFGARYEVFARGADLGVDLRGEATGTGPDVVQCKHMARSTFAQLNAAAKSEAAKVSKLRPSPSKYRLVTTHSLTAANKKTLIESMKPWLRSGADVIGEDDLEGLLNSHPQVERSHIKLWLSSAAQLDSALHSSIWNRSTRMLEDIRAALPRYVETDAFNVAREQFRAERVLVISGPPGIGKTTIAQMLVADAVADGYEPIEISDDIEEANSTVDPTKKRVFYYDDFLGSTFLQDRLSKNEDKRLASFVRLCAHSENNLLIMTTREHILHQAVSWYEELERSDIYLRRYLLELDTYSRYERGVILYNHVVGSNSLTQDDIEDLLSGDAFLKIIDHANYNPRLIEFLTGRPLEVSQDAPRAFMQQAIELLNNPSLVWHTAFERQLDEDSRDLVMVVASMDGPASLSSVEAAFEALALARGRTLVRGSFKSALRVLDDSFTRSFRLHDRVMLSVANPSVADFAAGWLQANHAEAQAGIDGASYFDQLDWLVEKVVEPSSGRQRKILETSLFGAVDRCWNSANASNPYLTEMTGRLLFVFKLLRRYPTFEILARDWFASSLTAISEAWAESAFVSVGTIAELVDELDAAGELSESLFDRAIKAARRGDTQRDWEAAAEMLGKHAFRAARYEVDTRRAFERWLSYRLTSEVEEIRDQDELGELRRLSEDLNAEISEADWENADDDLAQRSGPEFEPDVPHEPHAVLEGTLTAEEEDALVRTLFVRLADAS